MLTCCHTSMQHSHYFRFSCAFRMYTDDFIRYMRRYCLLFDCYFVKMLRDQSSKLGRIGIDVFYFANGNGTSIKKP